MTKETHKPENRPVRKPLHSRNALAAEKRAGFVRRWVNDVPGRIEAFLEAGYQLVESTEDTSDNKVQTESHLSGSVARKVVNKDPNATTKYAVLMEIPEKFYKEDQDAKQARVDDIEKGYNPDKYNKDSPFYGTLEKKYS